MKDPILYNAPKPRGKVVNLRLFVDSSNADNKMTRRSQLGHFVFINIAPIAWLLKKQSTVEINITSILNYRLNEEIGY